jgi:hypothetical protein
MLSNLDVCICKMYGTYVYKHLYIGHMYIYIYIRKNNISITKYIIRAQIFDFRTLLEQIIFKANTSRLQLLC